MVNFVLLLVGISGWNFSGGNYNKDFCDAASKGELEKIQNLLKQVENINFKCSGGHFSTAFMIASGKGHLEIVKLLLPDVNDINDKDGDGNTALMAASSNGHLNIVIELLHRVKDVNERNKKNKPRFPFQLTGSTRKLLNIYCLKVLVSLSCLI